ncbi:MAG: hypothetical protein GEU83_15615 [Pseudonocardiaceae bacterium]|nr:hypothetical protein [Pseudonocardiaceae bacterium]
MSLAVSPELQLRAQEGRVSDEEFIECIRESLPYAWSVVNGLVGELQQKPGIGFANSQAVPPNDDAQGELLRLVASDAMRSVIERHYGVRLAFQNCCTLALFNPDAHDAYNAFVSTQAQLLNQRPELVNC